MISGRMAANEMAAIVHHEMPWLPVWLATMTGRVMVFGGGQQRREEVLVPGQHEREHEGRHHARQGDGHDDAEERAPDALAVDQGGLLQLRRDGHELVAHDPDDDGQHRQRVEHDQPDVRVQQRQLLVEDEEGQGQDHRRQDELADEEERDVRVLHVPELVAEARQPVAGERAQEDRQARGGDGDDGRVR